MHSYYNKPTRTYIPSDEARLKEARDQLFIRPEYGAERSKVFTIIDPLTKSGEHDLVRAFWVFQLQSHQTDGSNTDEKANPQETLAKYALNITPENECDAATRLNYLKKFINGIDRKISHPLDNAWMDPRDRIEHREIWKPSEEDRQLAIYHCACLLYEMKLINNPATAIDTFGSIPTDYFYKKRSKPAGIVAAVKNVASTFYNHDDDRRKQLAFIQVMYQLLLKFNKDTPKEKFCSYLENHPDAVRMTIAKEIEKERTDHDPINSDLHKLMLSGLGYDESAHSSDLPENIIKIRLTQLMKFLARITDDDFDEAAAKTNCSQKALDDCREHYFKNYRTLLPQLIATKLVRRSQSEAAIINLSQTSWAVVATLLTWTIPSAAQKTYYLTGLDQVASTVAYCASKEAGARFRPVARWFIEFAVKHGGGAALDGAAITGIESALYYFLLGNSTVREQKYIADAPQISFVDFITLCLANAKKAKDQKNMTLYEDILFIFPLLPADFQRAFDRNVPALYFIPDATKPKCPFKIEMLPQLKPENVSSPLPPVPPPEPAYNPLCYPALRAVPEGSAPAHGDWVLCDPPPYTPSTPTLTK